MPARSVESFYERFYGGEKARRGVFEAIAAWRQPKRVLYPGSFIHVTASFVFPAVGYVDTDSRAKQFFAERDEVVAFVNRHKVYRQRAELAFHAASYEDELPVADRSVDLLLSLYAGFISKPCKRYLRVGGVLAVNDSHGDASLASIDPDYALVGVLRGRGDRLRVVEDGLAAYFEPKQKKTKVTEALLRKQGRGIAYTVTAPVYLFERVRRAAAVQSR